ncbi:lantibiotic dehydratase [Clostridium minihomine]|uniref:lantibiotic dehydratase n=1 Tax=Clostridium minihomine TaxID=2045012 RepID=UPI0013EAE7A5|nr:lantibiotic dehydratase [Clostridium minihomine]
MPSFHVCRYLQSKKSAKEYIQENGIEDAFLESLLISSQSLYHSYLEDTEAHIKKNKKIKMLNKSLTRYLIRASSRPTPFGTWARVGLGSWGKEDSVVIDSKKFRKKATVDELWMSYIISQLEKDLDLLQHLDLKMNPILYPQGDRIKNPFCSNHGLLGTKDRKEVLLQSHIRKTGLIDFLAKEAKDFIPCHSLMERIANEYVGIPTELVNHTLLQLIENEILITNLHLPSFCNDPLQHVLAVLEQTNCKVDLLKDLSELQDMIKRYENSSPNVELLQSIYQRMSAFYQADNYLKVDAGLQFQQNILSEDIKEILENFVEKFAKLAVNQTKTKNLNQFKNKFYEKYGPNVDVPIYEVIDEKSFHGLNYFSFESEFKDSDRELAIKSVLDQKILDAYLSKSEEIHLSLSDFDRLHLDEEELIYGSSFDLNTFIFKNDQNEYRLAIGPNVGSTSAGKMFQRFSEVYDPSSYHAYNQIYGKMIEKTKNNYCIAEIREAPTSGRIANIISTHKTYAHYIAMGNTEQNLEGEILLRDLAIGIQDNKQLYIKSLKTDQMVKVTTNHMLNVDLGSKIQKLLITISEEYESFPLSRIFSLYQNSYPYIPRIVFEKVILYPKMWFLFPDFFHLETLQTFEKDFMLFKERYQLDEMLYLAEGDNRLVIDITQKEYQEYLYEILKKKQIVNLREMEDKTFQQSIVRDENQNHYLAEYVFSFVARENPKANRSTRKSCLLQNTNHRYLLAENGWIYFKLYGVDNRETEFLTKLLKPSLNQLLPERFFFIRYRDDQNHLRIRLQYRTSEEAIHSLYELTSFLCQWREKGVVGNAVFDTYELEVNRYGGTGCIEELHEVFYQDSLWVIAMLEQFKVNDEDEKEMVYFVGMISAFLCLTDSVEELFETLNEEGLKNSNKPEFKKERLKYLRWFELIQKDHLEQIDERFLPLRNSYLKRQNAFRSFRDKIKSQTQLTNTKKEIQFSLVHMFCNRMTGVIEYESRCLSLIRHTVFHSLERMKHLSGQ